MLRNVNLKPYNTMGVAATADYFTTVHDLKELKAALDFARSKQIAPFILGAGANLLIVSDIVHRVVIRMAIAGFDIVGESLSTTYIKVGAGESWHQTVERTLTEGYPGLENLALIPGSVGASVVQNIGAYGSEVAQFVKEVEIYDPAVDEVRTLKAAECDFRYRHSIFKTPKARDWVVVSVTFVLPKTWQANLSYNDLAQAFSGVQNATPQAVFDQVVAIRKRKLPDPEQLGSAGSFFKNPIVTREVFQALLERFPSIVHYRMAGNMEKLAAGWLIDQAGLKGVRQGDAGTYEKQALVLVNHGEASGAELWQFAEYVREKVFDLFGVTLEPEPVILRD